MPTLAPQPTAAPREIIPRAALWVAAVVMLLTLGAVAAQRLWADPTRPAYAATVAQRALHFKALPDGGVAVIDAATGARLETMYGEQGFLRGTLRGLVRERKRNGMDSSEPLQLISRADGRLTLVDGTTGQHLDLESFGPTNAAVYARWLPPTAGAKP